jgi:hypothetical protein
MRHRLSFCSQAQMYMIYLFIYLFVESYSVSAAFCAAMPGGTGVVDSGHGANVNSRRPTSSLKRPSVSKNLPFSMNHYLHWLAPHLDSSSTNSILCF